MKRIALYIGIVASLVASCSIQEEDFKAPAQDDVIFYASFEQPSEGTRVYANEDLRLRWNANDRVSIFNKNTYNQEYKFLGETGDNSGEFNKVETNVFVTGNEIPHVVSVFPYQRGTTITEDETLALTLPAFQHYAENTFGFGSNTMVSVSEDSLLQYKSVGGYLRISLYGEGMTVSSITLKGNNGEKIAGKASVSMPLDGVPGLIMASDATDAITLVCDTPVALGAKAEESKHFWFVVPPVTFSQGFAITVIMTGGEMFVKSTSQSITINRSHLSKMSPMEVIGTTPIPTPTVPIPEAVDLGLLSGIKWASFNVGASNPEEYGDHYAWGEIEPKADYSLSTYKWSIDMALTRYCPDSYFGYDGFSDTKIILDPEDDAAHMAFGGEWRMPADAEWTELRETCTWEWTSMNGVNGSMVTGPNGNTIFLPAAGSHYGEELLSIDSEGVYWSSSLHPYLMNSAWDVFFYSGTVGRSRSNRYLGSSIRPVSGDPFQAVESVTLNQSELELSIGESSPLVATVLPDNATVKAVTWSSRDNSIATVSSTGVVTGVSVGSAIIRVYTLDGGNEATCHVTVSFPVPEAVDLGLPSGLKWASFNLGALKPEEYGYYYAWGEADSSSKSYYNWFTYKWCMGYENTLTKYCADSYHGYYDRTDEKTVLDPEDDAAHVNLSGNWRMPTKAEWTELQENCTWEWTTLNGVNGQKVTSKKSGYTDKWIFLPAAGIRNEDYLSFDGSEGYYWSSSLGTDYVDNPNHAWFVTFDSADVGIYGNYRYYGFSVRPVTE